MLFLLFRLSDCLGFLVFLKVLLRLGFFNVSSVVASFRAQVTFLGLATMATVATGYQIKKDSYKRNV